MSDQSQVDGLKSLERPDALVPECRIRDALSLQNYVQGFIDNDDLRNKVRAKVQGLVDGNPPYSPKRLKDAGRPDACNVNWQTAWSYMTTAMGIFFDLFAEAPTYFTARTSFGSDDAERDAHGRKMSENAYRVLSKDSRWEYVVQMSQQQMVLQGPGPLWFEDDDRVLPRWLKAGDLQVDEDAQSETAYWEFCAILVDYKVHELYEFIADEEIATRLGWDVDYTKGVIMNAVPKNQRPDKNSNWEWYQDQFKKKSFAAFQQSDCVQLAHCFWKEFNGTITHAIIERATGSGPNSTTESKKKEGESVSYLFIQQGKIRTWDEFIHPMWYDKGNGSHYTVGGLGTRMYGGMTFENRLRCNLADKAMSPKLIFKRSSESATPFSLKPMGDYSVLEAGFDLAQTPIGGLLEDGMIMLNEASRTTSANLAQFRQGLSREDKGNPITKGEAQMRMQQQYAVAGTSISRYYQQLDKFYTEVMRRLCNLNSRDPLAHKFQQMCKDDGVPVEAIGRVTDVEANRVAGQGSAALRQQALNNIMQAISRLPEDGQDNLMEAWIASQVGQRNVKQFFPRKAASGPMGNDQEADAMQWVAAMKVGVPPVMSPHQDPVVHATTYLSASGQALGTIPQGANPVEVLKFVDIAMPAAHAHMQRFAQDPTRKGLYAELSQMAQQIATVADKFKTKLMQAQAKAKGKQGQNGNGSVQLTPEEQHELAFQKAKDDLKLRQMALSHQQRFQQRAEKHIQDQRAAAARVQSEVAAKDLLTASSIRASRLKAFSE